MRIEEKQKFNPLLPPNISKGIRRILRLLNALTSLCAAVLPEQFKAPRMFEIVANKEQRYVTALILATFAPLLH